MKVFREDKLLYAVTDRSWLQGEALEDVLEKALRGGVGLVQLREKKMDKADFLEEAGRIRKLCKKYGVPLLINDDVEIALAVDADGVHVGQSDMEAGEARARLGPDKIIGVSARTVEQAILAREKGADYLGVGAVFPTSSKENAETIGLERLRAICEAVEIPVFAIGGITAENIGQLAGTGISGAAVISALFAQPDVEQAARELKDKIRKL